LWGQAVLEKKMFAVLPKRRKAGSAKEKSRQHCPKLKNTQGREINRNVVIYKRL